ncbi:MAG: hypothetical protein B7Y75_05165 [Azorhizobium sp. 35-67-5]|nr:MAG: hypothetical protein B7Y75_05165 [Azorhizobium sp. 35-67-5]
MVKADATKQCAESPSQRVFRHLRTLAAAPGFVNGSRPGGRLCVRASMPKVVEIAGDMDAAAMAELKATFEALGSGAEDVVLELGQVEFMDSSGVGGIVFLYKRLRVAGCKLRLRGAHGQALQLLTHLRLSDLVDEGSAP